MRPVVLMLLTAVAFCPEPRSQSEPTIDIRSIGFRDISLPNASDRGSPSLDARVFYPARGEGQDAPFLPRPGGYPVLVYMHGFGVLGRNYVELGIEYASRGYLAVMADTAANDPLLQADDGAAIFGALVTENTNPQSFLFGQLDMTRAALAGHSMGGANVVRILADNPGYRVGIALAPYVGTRGDYTKDHAPRVKAPVLILTGEGDNLVPWKDHAAIVYEQLTAYRGIKLLYLLNKDCDHANVASWLWGPQPTYREVFDSCQKVFGGMLDRYVLGKQEALDRVIGRSARREPRLAAIRLEIEQPEYFKVTADKLGGASAYQLAGQPGLAVHMFAVFRGHFPLPIGTLLLDPGTLNFVKAEAIGNDRLSVFDVQLPNVPEYHGIVVPFQAIAYGRDRIWLTNGLDMRLTR